MNGIRTRRRDVDRARRKGSRCSGPASNVPRRVHLLATISCVNVAGTCACLPLPLSSRNISLAFSSRSVERECSRWLAILRFETDEFCHARVKLALALIIRFHRRRRAFKRSSFAVHLFIVTAQVIMNDDKKSDSTYERACRIALN